MRHVGPRPTLLLSLVVLTACGSSGDLTTQLDTVSSWTATMGLAIAQYRAGALTATYAAQLSVAARQALDAARQSLPDAEHDPTDTRRAAASLDSLDRAITALGAATHP